MAPWERACPAMASDQTTMLSALTPSRGKPAPTFRYCLEALRPASSNRWYSSSFSPLG